MGATGPGFVQRGDKLEAAIAIVAFPPLNPHRVKTGSSKGSRRGEPAFAAGRNCLSCLGFGTDCAEEPVTLAESSRPSALEAGRRSIYTSAVPESSKSRQLSRVNETER